MKFTLLMLIATSSGMRLEGIPESSLQSGAHWRKPWPEGAVDDGTNDNMVFHTSKPEKVPKPPRRYHDNFRQWQPDTWPVHFTWSGDHAVYHNQVDDGTDDADWVAIQRHNDNI